MVFSYQIIKFESIEFVQGTDWSQSTGDRGIMYKAVRDPFAKIIVQTLNGTKTLYHVPKDRTAVIVNDVIHFLGELA